MPSLTLTLATAPLEDNLARLDPCVLCGSLGHLVECRVDGAPFFDFYACKACLPGARTRVVRLRPIRESMRACGVPDDIANEAMTYLLNLLFDI